MEEKRIIEAWYFAETVEGIDDIVSFLECKNEVEKTGFDKWLNEQGLAKDFGCWLVKHGIDYTQKQSVDMKDVLVEVFRKDGYKLEWNGNEPIISDLDDSNE